jgi:hypothetical protein
VEHARRGALALTLALILILPFGAMDGAPAEETLPDFVEWINLSPMPSANDIMNDEIPHVTVLGNSLVFCWETDYTHWPNPDGSQPIEYPEDEDIQIRFMTNGTLGPLFNVSTDGVKPEGYGHRSAMTVYQEKLYVWWNSHAWSENETFQVVLRVYDPATETWDTPRPISNTPNGGIAAGASADVHEGRLWFAWQARYPVDENETDPGLEIYGRWTDGTDWGPVHRISHGLEGQDTEPAVLSTGDQLHVAWSHDDPVMPGNADIHHRIMGPGGGWSAVIESLGNGPDRNEKKVSLMGWNGTPVLLWQSDGINQRGQVYSDVMIMLFQEDAWGTPLLVSPPGKDSGNVVPSGIEFRGHLYIGWATGDDGITIGTDLDVVIRDFDGERFGDIVVLSPADTHVENNPSDDGSVELVIFQGNLYAVFDAIFSPVTDAFNKDVLFRYIGYDMDGDGADDSVDAFPLDPAEQNDTDGDGVGDNADAYPNDRNRWKKDVDPNEGLISGDLCMVVAMLTAVSMPFVLLAGMHYSQKRKKKGKP